MKKQKGMQKIQRGEMVKADTNEMRRIASEINSEAIRYQALITGLFNRFANMSQTREWVGKRAQDYVGYVMLEKPDLMSVGDKLKNLSKVILNDASLLETTSVKIETDESNG